MNIEEIKARTEAATPGPWRWEVSTVNKGISLESTRYKIMDFVRYGMNQAAPRFLVDNFFMERADKLTKSIPGKEHHIGFDDYIDHPDAEFIAHARKDIPLLIEEVERLKVELEHSNQFEVKWGIDWGEIENIPLTLEEVREYAKQGRPLWVDARKEFNSAPCDWAHTSISLQDKVISLMFSKHGYWLIPDLSKYGETWLCYADDPEAVQE